MDAPTTLPAEQVIHLVDVGGAGGVQDKWAPYASIISPVLFEPNPEQAVLLRDQTARQYQNPIIEEIALANIDGELKLNIANYFGCSSILQPNMDVLQAYRIAPLFLTRQVEPIMCARYDTLHFAGRVPKPDMIKIDVQGFEYEVLLGFGGLLQNALCIELETHLYPIYRDQKLMHELVAYLADFDFTLRRVTPVQSFDGDVVEMDVWFTKNIDVWRKLDDEKKQKFALICGVCELVDYSRIKPGHSHNEL